MATKKTKLAEDMQPCAQILKALKNHENAAPFLEPVDWEGLGLPDYPEIVKHPMDLGTVETKLNAGKYANPELFARDVRLVWGNAKKYNRPDSDIHKMASDLEAFFEKKFKGIKKTGGGGGGSNKRRSGAKTEVREVTRTDRVKFSHLVNQLSSDELGHVLGIIQRQCPEALNEEDDDELEIEINNIDANTLLELNAYAQECISASGSNIKKKKR